MNKFFHHYINCYNKSMQKDAGALSFILQLMKGKKGLAPGNYKKMVKVRRAARDTAKENGEDFISFRDIGPENGDKSYASGLYSPTKKRIYIDKRTQATRERPSMYIRPWIKDETKFNFKTNKDTLSKGEILETRNHELAHFYQSEAPSGLLGHISHYAVNPNRDRVSGIVDQTLYGGASLAAELHARVVTDGLRKGVDNMIHDAPSYAKVYKDFPIASGIFSAASKLPYLKTVEEGAKTIGIGAGIATGIGAAATGAGTVAGNAAVKLRDSMHSPVNNNSAQLPPYNPNANNKRPNFNKLF